MLKRVNEILIGKNITRTVALADAAALTVVQENILEGEVVVLDKNFAVAAVDITYADSDVIYIAEGSKDDFSYTNEAGTALAGKRLILSSPIHGDRVSIYSGAGYVANAEQQIDFPAISDTIVAGTEYLLRVVYHDLYERPAPYTETYRYTAKAGDASTNVYDGIAARVAKYTGKLSVKGGARITATNNAGVLEVVGKAIPECTTSVNDIDEYTQVYFDAYLNYVDSDGNWTEVGLSSAKSNTPHVRGSGSWEVIRDIEKHAQSYRGIENRIWFPVAAPDMRTLKNANYGSIVIEHDPEYRSADNQYVKSTPKTTMTVVPNEAGTNQGVNIQTRLNSYFASTPQTFPAVAVFS
jgi:predicted RecA/RadA family phage recombinase